MFREIFGKNVEFTPTGFSFLFLKSSKSVTKKKLTVKSYIEITVFFVFSFVLSNNTRSDVVR